MICTYEFELFEKNNQWCAFPFDLPSATQGNSMQEACESAADFLHEIALDSLVNNRTMPPATFGNKLEHDGERLVVSVSASLADVEKVSAARAAEILGVSRSRITAMLAHGLLEGWRDGRNTWITLNSVNARLEYAPKAGRPPMAASIEPHASQRAVAQAGTSDGGQLGRAADHSARAALAAATSAHKRA